MDIDRIKELLQAVSGTDVVELEIHDGSEQVRIRRSPRRTGGPMGGGHVGSTAAAGSSPQVAEAEEDVDLVLVRAPMVGTFYEGASPGSPAFVEIGDNVRQGQVLCIIEAMKLMNEIESDASGVVVKRFVSNAQPVEYGEALFAIRPE